MLRFNFPVLKSTTLTCLGLMPGLMLAVIVRCTSFARFAPRKVPAVVALGDVKLSNSQGFSYYCLLYSLPATENKRYTQRSVHSRIQMGWIGYFIFWERLQFTMSMKIESWFISLVSRVITSTFHQSQSAPTM